MTRHSSTHDRPYKKHTCHLLAERRHATNTPPLSLELDDSDAVFVHDFNHKVWLRDHESRMQLVDTFPNYFQTLLQIHVWLPLSVEHREDEVAAMSLGTEVHFRQRG